MNSLDHKIELFAKMEPSAADVQEAQGKLEAAIAQAPRRKAVPRVTGWLAAAASAFAAVAAFVWLPFGSNPALAFSDVQKHFSDFSSLRFEFEQRMNGNLLVKARVSVLANGSVRTEVGDDVVVIVNAAEKKMLTLVQSAHVAVQESLDNAPQKGDSLQWLQEIRDFQGAARALPDSRVIRGQKAQGWELTMDQVKMTIWSDAQGLPLQMQIDQGTKLDMDFTFDFDANLSPELFSTQVPAGYTLQAPDADDDDEDEDN